MAVSNNASSFFLNIRDRVAGDMAAVCSSRIIAMTVLYAFVAKAWDTGKRGKLPGKSKAINEYFPGGNLQSVSLLGSSPAYSILALPAFNEARADNLLQRNTKSHTAAKQSGKKGKGAGKKGKRTNTKARGPRQSHAAPATNGAVHDETTQSSPTPVHAHETTALVPSGPASN